MIRSSRVEFLVVFAMFAGLAGAMLFPLALHAGDLGYQLGYGDAQFSVWNVAWVAHALLTSPLHVLDANIFYPHRGTLAYSETNLGAGAVATPVYWLTRNPYAAHNIVLLLSFVMSGVATYYLVKHVTGDRRAALVAGICFAFCPHVFAHLPHIQLLMTAGLPLGLLAFHRLVERPAPSRAGWLGLAIAAQTYFCAYYAVFLILMIGYAVLFTAFWRRLWTDAAYWRAVATAALVSIVGALPLIAVYIALRRTTGFTRPLSAAQSYAADWRAYLASSAYAHAWMLGFLHNWREVLFPGFLAVSLGIAGFFLGLRAGGRRREAAVLYGSIAVLALWESFGPSAGLYRASYALIPAFSFMRAPSRFGLVFTLALAVLSGICIARLIERHRWFRRAAWLLAIAACAELFTPLVFAPVPHESGAYQRLASLPDGPVIEMPLYSDRFAFARTRYMLSSTVHWKPLIDAYSDYIPQDFQESLDTLADFPDAQAFDRLKRYDARYVVFHVATYGAGAADLRSRLAAFSPYLRQIYADDETWLYEITGYPDRNAEARTNVVR